MPEVTSCPSCARQLRVPDSLLGKAVKCPSCGTNFTAGGSASSSAYTEPSPAPERPSRRSGYEEPSQPEESRSPRSGHDEPPPDQDQEYDETPRRSRRRRSRRGRGGAPHRGVLILVLSIIGLVMLFFCGFVTLPLCLPAWLMANHDLREMRSGYMDSEGEGITQAGRVCGIIGTILGALVYLAGCMYLLFFLVIIAAQPR